jgi:hypothetical protein
VETFDGRLRDEFLNENRFDDLAKPPHPVEERSNSDLINYEQRQCHCVTSGANIFYGKRLSGADPNQFLNGLLDALGRNTANGLSDGRNCGLLGGPRRLLSRRATGPDCRDPNVIGTPAASCLRNSCAYRSRATLGLLRRRRVIGKVFRNHKCL